MTGRTPAAAVRSLRGLLQQAVSCLTRAVLTVNRGGYAPAPLPHLLTFERGGVHLAGSAGIAFTVEHYYWPIEGTRGRERWHAETAGYSYALDDTDGHEILTYHWHPLSASPATSPHLHLGAGAIIGREELVRAHLPTGFITLPDVIRLAIEAFGVRPLRPDWSHVLHQTHAVLIA